MSNNVEIVQSFIRRYINKEVKEYFKDVQGNDASSLSLSAPRSAIKLVCLHQDKDPIMLTILRLLIYWVEARGLFDEFIYGIPSTDFEISHTYYPQVKLHFRENRYESSTNNRKPARGEVSFRWIETDFTTANIDKLTDKIQSSFVKPVFSYQRGRQLWTYADKSKGHYFQLTVDSETTAKKVIEQVIRLQGNEAPDWDKYLKFHQDKKNYNIAGTVRVEGENRRKPKKRPIAKVEFAYAELFIPGTTKPIVLIDRTGNKVSARRYA